MHLFAGDAKKTLHQLCVDVKSSRITQEIETAGDGTVTRTSAISERKLVNKKVLRMLPWTMETFLSTDHLGLTRDRSFVDNILYHLLNQPTTFN